MEVTLLYSTDAWHSHASYSLQGVFTDNKVLKQYLIDMKSEGKISKEDLEELRKQQQTQGRELNYLLEVLEANPTYESK